MATELERFIESTLPTLTNDEINTLFDAIDKRLDELENDPNARALREGIRAARRRAIKNGVKGGSDVSGIIAGMREARGK